MQTRRRRLPGEITFTVILLLISLFMLWTAYGISGLDSLSSAGAFPLLATAVMVLTGLANIVHTARETPSEPEAGESPAGQFMRRLTPPVLIGFTTAIVVYMMALERVGFLIASYLFLVVSMWLLGSRRIGLVLIVSALSLGAIYLIFQTAFSVVLPSGTLLQGLLK